MRTPKLLLMVIAMVAVSLSTKAGLNDVEIAKACAKTASNLLNEDLQSQKGVLYYNVARALHPTADSVLLIGGFLDRQKNPPKEATAMPEHQLLAELKSRGMYLVKNAFLKNGRVGKIALLYLRVVDQTDKQDADVLQAIVYLQTYGINAPLSDLLAERFDLKDIYQNPERPHKVGEIDLDNYDQRIAEECIKMGSMLLAADTDSRKGLDLVRLGCHLKPDDSRALLVLQQLQRSMKVKQYPTKVTEGQLASVLAKRGAQFLEKAENDEVAAHLALTYFRMLDRLIKDDKRAILGITKLERMGHSRDLDGLLEENLADLVAANKTDIAVAFQEESNPRPSNPGNQLGSPNRRPNFVQGEKHEKIKADADEIDGSKIRVDADTHKRRERLTDYSYSSDTKLEEVSLKVEINNYVQADLTGLTFETYLVAKKLRGDVYFIAAKDVQKDVKLKERGRIELRKIKAYMGYNKDGGWGSKYAGYMVIIKDAKGKILNVDSGRDGFLEENAEKIMKYQVARRLTFYSYYYYYSSYSDYFDKNGDKIGGN